MKNIHFLILLISFTSCKKELIIKTQYNFDFLIGKWIRTNDQKDKITYENWIKTNDSLYSGLGFTLKGNDTIFKENMELKKENKQWNLVVSGVHEKPISFKLTSFTATNFIAENQKNEFPKEIKYQLKNTALVAEVSADSIKIQFTFKKYKSNKIFLIFFNTFSTDSIFQHQNIKFPIKNSNSFYSNNKDIVITNFINSSDWNFIDFTKDKDVLNNKFTQEFEFVDSLNITYKRIGYDKEIMVNYYFKKIKNHWFLVKIENLSN